MHDRPVVVTVPAKDEAEHLPACLDALINQDGQRDHQVLVLVNNTTDASSMIARAIAARSPVAIRVEEVVLHGAEASAGGARRLAMRLAAEQAGASGIIMTTDADGRVAPDWLATNLRAIRQGADAVAGRALIDPIEEARIPQALRDADARECGYAALLNELAATLDPDPADPWPHHSEHSGASIAVTVRAYDRAGGMPAKPTGEDRAFFRRLQRIDARIRHANDALVVVSGRIDGRAAGGMAETIRRRMFCPDVFLDDALEPAQDAATRARLRRRARLLWSASAPAGYETEELAAALRLPGRLVRACLEGPLFGAAWHDLESESPRLRRPRRVPAAAVMHETSIARSLLAELRARSGESDMALEITA